jgi:hypothetical protein
MAIVSAYHNGEYLGLIQTYSAHNLTLGQVVTVRNMICGDTCTARILKPAEYTDRFYTSTFPVYRWCVIVDVQEPWKRPEPPDHSRNCTESCLTTSSRKTPALRLNSVSDIIPSKKG